MEILGKSLEGINTKQTRKRGVWAGKKRGNWSSARGEKRRTTNTDLHGVAPSRAGGNMQRNDRTQMTEGLESGNNDSKRNGKGRSE